MESNVNKYIKEIDTTDEIKVELAARALGFLKGGGNNPENAVNLAWRQYKQDNMISSSRHGSKARHQR